MTMQPYQPGEHPASREALEGNRERSQWQKGQSGNPSGRPKGQNVVIQPALRKFLAMGPMEFMMVDPAELTMAETIAWTMVLNAVRAWHSPGLMFNTQQLLIQRLEGPTSKLEPIGEVGEGDRWFLAVRRITEEFLEYRRSNNDNVQDSSPDTPDAQAAAPPRRPARPRPKSPRSPKSPGR